MRILDLDLVECKSIIYIAPVIMSINYSADLVIGELLKPPEEAFFKVRY